MTNVAPIDDARRDLDMTSHQLWVGYFAVGGDATALEVEGWLEGRLLVPLRDYVLLAQAVHDRACDEGAARVALFRHL